MSKLNLPRPTMPLPPSKRLTMDEYVRFVQMQAEFRFETKRAERDVSADRKYVRFRLC